QAAQIADALESGLDRLLEGESGWRGKAAEAYRDTVKEIIKFAREFAHVADSENLPPTNSHDPDTGGFGSGSKSYYQILEEAMDEFAHVGGVRVEPPYWWTNDPEGRGRLGVYGGWKEQNPADDIICRIVERKVGVSKWDLPYYPVPGYGARDFSASEMCGEDGEGGFYKKAGVPVYQEGSHYFPDGERALQDLWLHLRL